MKFRKLWLVFLFFNQNIFCYWTINANLKVNRQKMIASRSCYQRLNINLYIFKFLDFTCYTYSTRIMWMKHLISYQKSGFLKPVNQLIQCHTLFLQFLTYVIDSKKVKPKRGQIYRRGSRLLTWPNIVHTSDIIKFILFAVSIFFFFFRYRVRIYSSVLLLFQDESWIIAFFSR